MEPLFSQQIVIFKKYQKITAFFLLIVLLTVSLSSFSANDNNYNYIKTEIIFKDKNDSFLINGNTIKNKADDSQPFLNTYDTVNTLDHQITLIFNKTSAITLMPHSQAIFFQLGENPYLRLITGEIDVQTIGKINVDTNYHKIVIKQGASNIKQNDDSLQIGNYHGSSQVEIYQEQDEQNQINDYSTPLKSKPNKIITYAIPIKKQIDIKKSFNKINWPQIRYSKLNNEIMLSNFHGLMNSQIFMPEVKEITNNRTSLLKKWLTLNPQKKIAIDQSNFFETVNKLTKIVQDSSHNQIKTTVPNLAPFKNMVIDYKVNNLISIAKDPLTRYNLETALMNLLAEPDNSIDTEIKYFNSLWKKKDKNEIAIIEELNKKIDQHSKIKEKDQAVLSLEEDYNLITALIENYPKVASLEIIKSKSLIEDYLYSLLNSDTEKIDIIVKSYDTDLHIISELITNDNIEVADLAFQQMLIKKVDNTYKYHPTILAITKDANHTMAENKITQMFDFYKESLHASNNKKVFSFNEDSFEAYEKKVTKEKEAEELRQKNVKKLPKKMRKTPYDFSDVAKQLNNHSINVDRKNIFFVTTGSELLFVKDASLITKEADKENTFNFLYYPNPDANKAIISKLIWNGKNAPILPIMNEEIPLAKFQDVYLKICQEKIDEKKLKLVASANETIIKDWVLNQNYNEIVSYENALKKRLIKQQLFNAGLLAQENLMEIKDNVISIDDALAIVKEDKENKQNKSIEIKVNLRISFLENKNTNQYIWQVLSIQLDEFPKNKIRASEISEVYSKVVANYQEEMDRKAMKENIVKLFADISSKELTLDDFNFISFEEGTMQFNKLPVVVNGVNNNKEEWFVSGVLDANGSNNDCSEDNSCEIIKNGTISFGNNIIKMENLPINKIKNKITEYQMEQKAKSELAPRRVKKEDEINDSVEAETLIKDAIYDNLETDMPAIKKALLDL